MAAKDGCVVWSVLFILGAGVVGLCFLIGALGPAHTVSSEFSMAMCMGRDLVARSKGELVDHDSCTRYGQVNAEYGFSDHFDHTVKDMVLLAEMPYRNVEAVFSRWFHFMMVDLDVQFKSRKFLNDIHDADIPLLALDVSIGYRDTLKGPWKMLSNGTVVRHLNCPVDEQTGQRECNMVPLFELGSVHHLRYLVNLRFHFIPLADHVHEYRGLSQLSDFSLIEIHQSLRFTQIWLAMKSVLFVLTTASLVTYLARGRGRPKNLVDKTLIWAGMAVACLGFPIEFLSLFIDCPWMIVYSDIRSGLVILALCIHWIVFIGEHTEVSQTGQSIIKYWKQILCISLSCSTLFVYEFCERGIQVVYPFFTMWESPTTAKVAYSFLWVAIGLAVLYALMLVAAVVQVWWSITKKEKILETMSEGAKLDYRKSMSRFKFLLFVLVVTSALVISTFVPTELHEYGLEASPETYSIYSGILTGTYSLFNVYVIIVLIVSTLGMQDNPTRSADHILAKYSQE